MNEKKKPGVSEYEHPEYVTRQINRYSGDCGLPEYVTRQINRYSGASFETIVLCDFCTFLKILISFSLIKRFPNDHKRYSSCLPVSILY